MGIPQFRPWNFGLDPSLPMVHRNLAIAWSNQPHGNDLGKAIAALEKAVSLPDPSPLHFAELDELYQAAGIAPEQRLRMLEEHREIVAQRAESLSREIALLVFAGRYDEAIRLMTGRRFEVWEGGSLSVAEDWGNAHILRGHRRRAEGRFQEALADFRSAGQVPDNLPSNQVSDNARTAEIAYATGLVHEAMGEKEQAHKAWEQATSLDRGGQRRGGNAGPSKRSIARYGQGLALKKLGRAGEAEVIFRELVETARHALENAPQIDPAAAVATQQSQRDRLAQAHYVAGLGALGLRRRDESRREMAKCLKLSPDHLGAKTTLADLEKSGSSRVDGSRGP
jgi:tetratricopeptide (TPR) repeat protein